MTLAVATNYNDRLRCSVDIVRLIESGPVPREHFRAIARILRRVEYGDERDPKMRAFPRTYRAGQQRAENLEAPLRDSGQKEPDPRVPGLSPNRWSVNCPEERHPRMVLKWHRMKGMVSAKKKMWTTSSTLRCYSSGGFYWN